VKLLRQINHAESGPAENAVQQMDCILSMASPMASMEDWTGYLDRILQADDRELLTNSGSISAEIAREHALTEFEKYRVIQDRLFKSNYNRFIAQMNILEEKVERE